MLTLSPYSIPPFVGAVFSILIGMFVFLKNKRSQNNLSFFLFCLSVFIWLFGYTVAYSTKDFNTAVFFCRVACAGACFTAPAFYHFSVSFLGLEKERKFVWITYGIMGLIAPFSLISPYFLIGAWPYYWGYYSKAGLLHPVYLVIFFSIFTRGFYLLSRALREKGISYARKLQLKYAFIAYIVALLGAIDYIPKYGVEFYPFGFTFETLFLIIIAYAIVRYRLMDINLVITRTTVFMGVYALLLGLPLVGALAWQQRFEYLMGPRWWVGLWLLVAGLTTLAHYANLYLQRRAEDRMLSEQRRYQTVLRQAAQGMTLIKEMDKLLGLIVHILTRAVKITHAAVYLLDKEAQQYVLRARRGKAGIGDSPLRACLPARQGQSPFGSGGKGQSPSGEQSLVELGCTVPAGSPLIAELKRQKGAIVQEELKLQTQGGGGSPQMVEAEQAMGEIQAAVIVPSFVEEQLLGFLVLGEKRSGQMYSQDDLQVFEVLASQAALAVENAQFYDELQRTQADLFQTAKMATLGQMAGGMSHQINNRFYVLTILAGTMKAALRALDLSGVRPELQELVTKTVTTFEKIEDNAIRGGDIVKTLLRFSRPSRGDQKPISVQEMVETALDVVQYKINLEEIDFSKELPSDLPLIQGNLNQLADSLFNLFSNAYDAIQAKGERLKPEGYRGSIAVKARKVNGKLELTISDNGIGMTPQELSQLFIPFFTTKASSEKGTGLGLFIIKRIVEHHGGAITARSAFGEGTQFVITLPAAQAQQAVA